MNKKYIPILLFIVLVFAVITFFYTRATTSTATPLEARSILSGSFDNAKQKSDEEWKKILSPDEFHILREAGTEIPFTGKLNDENRKGTYVSVGCSTPVFRSEQKYDSGTGWPSFWAPISEDSLVLRLEIDGRIEVLDKCGGHLGHVFDDGPEVLPDGRKATGKRYCMNSIALKFIPD